MPYEKAAEHLYSTAYLLNTIYLSILKSSFHEARLQVSALPLFVVRFSATNAKNISPP
ncbi:hypothetical protein ACIQ34_11780 [Ureibacillus sp. NPDC094379]